MNYHPDDYVALCNAIEAEGGNLPPEPCSGHVFRLKQPDPSGKMVWKCFSTVHCDESALADVPYDPKLHVRLMDDEDSDVCIVEHVGEKLDKGMVRVCAVDDAIGLWPRFQGVVSSRSYQNP